MTIHFKSRIVQIVTLALALSSTALFNSQANAYTVFDPANYSQNLLTAIRTLETVAQNATQISNQVQQIQNQAAMLRSIDINTAAQLASQLGILNQEYAQASQIFFRADQITTQMRDLFPDADDLYNFPDIANNAKAFVERSRQLGEYSARVHASVLENSPNTQARVLSLIAASNSAAGQTGATQAGNQLLATLSGQMTSMTAVMSAHHQTVENRIAEDSAQRERVRAAARNTTNFENPEPLDEYICALCQ